MKVHFWSTYMVLNHELKTETHHPDWPNGVLTKYAFYFDIKPNPTIRLILIKIPICVAVGNVPTYYILFLKRIQANTQFGALRCVPFVSRKRIFGQQSVSQWNPAVDVF